MRINTSALQPDIAFKRERPYSDFNQFKPDFAVAESNYERDVRRVARAVLSSVRSSLEIPYASHHTRNDTERLDLVKEILLAIESARISFTVGKTHGSAKRKLASDIMNIRAEPLFRDVLQSIKFRMMHINEARINMSSRMTSRFSTDLSVDGALSLLQDLLLEDVHPDLPLPGMSSLREIVPNQKVAPVQFEISQNKIIVSPHQSRARESDTRNIEAAKSELFRNGARIIHELELSNCDKRLLESIQELHAQFESEVDVVKIGLMNIGCEMMCSSFEEELPIAVASMLRAHIRGVQMFIGQFPEWNKFVANAAAADLDKSDIAELKAASQKVIEELRAHPELVNLAVPRTLAYLTELLNNPTLSGKRAAFALLRSLENLISRVFSYGAEFVEQTTKKTIDNASTVTSKVVVGMLLLALGGAVAIGPVSGKIPDMNWLKTATEIVKKQLHEMIEK